MTKNGQTSLDQEVQLVPQATDHVETVESIEEVLPRGVCSQFRSKIAKLAFPGLVALGLSSGCSPAPMATSAQKLTVAPHMMAEVQQPAHHVFAELLMQPGSPFQGITVQASIRPQDHTLVLGGFIIPTRSKQAIMVNVTSDKPASQGFYVFSETKGDLSYQINMDKALMDWIYSTPYDFVVHVEQSIDQQGIRTNTYDPRYKALVSVRIVKSGDFQTKSAGDIVLTRDRIQAVADQRTNTAG